VIGAGRRRASGVALWAWVAIVLVFLFAPIAVSVVYAFNAGVEGRQTSAFTGWTAQWFGAALDDDSLRDGAVTSLVTAFWTAILSVVVGFALGFALVRHPSRTVRRVLAAFTYALLVVPETVIGVALLLMYSETRIPLGLATLVAGHTPLSISVVALVIRARLLTLDPHLEEASADLGAGRLRTLRSIVLPQLGPSLAAAALLAYTFSFDNVVISNFLSTAQLSTLPVYLYGSLQYGPTPKVYAATTVLFVVSLLLIAIAALLLRVVARRGGGGGVRALVPGGAS
jgi:ABC-type spermidine/putrescine transport system permease subunit II